MTAGAIWQTAVDHLHQQNFPKRATRTFCCIQRNIFFQKKKEDYERVGSWVPKGARDRGLSRIGCVFPLKKRSIEGEWQKSVPSLISWLYGDAYGFFCLKPHSGL